MPHNIIVSAATALNNHNITYAAEVQQAFRVGLEFEGALPFVQAEKTYASVNVDVANLIQPYQPQFTPQNVETWGAVQNDLRPIKIDLEFTEEQLAELYDKWATQYFQAGTNATEWTYPKYVIENLIAPKFTEEINSLSYNGAYVAPTAGTPGAVLESCDGFKTKIAAAILAGTLTPVASGAFTTSNIREKVEDWMKAMPVAVRGRRGTIYMSDTNARNYYYDFRGDFSQSTWQSILASGGMSVDGFDVKIVGVKAMEGSNRWIFVPEGSSNMIVGTRRGYPVYPQFIYDGSGLYSLKAKAVIYRFYGVEFWNKLYVNDQA